MTKYCFVAIINISNRFYADSIYFEGLSNRFDIINYDENGGSIMKEEMQVTNERYRLGYHLMTKGGWMNDPNGLSYFKGYYHIFYHLNCIIYCFF